MLLAVRIDIKKLRISTRWRQSAQKAYETGIVRAMGLKETATAESAQFEAEEVTMLTVRCYSGYGG